MSENLDSPAPHDNHVVSELPTSEPTFHGRQIVANRYEILSRLGKGGMGEVWHAYDLKLRVDVALKSLRIDIKRNEDRVEALRREVRTAREVISPNVCRIFDLVVEEEQELISMEYIDGITLTAMLVKRGALELREARDIAAQFLAGLEAIHLAGLVHRDLKPENIMITRTGRVVVMDFGIAKQVTQLGGTIAGTVPYMSPEQLAGEKVDARSDVFSAGVVLAEMIHPEGVYSQKTREVIWNAVRKTPLQIPDSPWKAVIARAVAAEPENRFASAGALARALEEVTQRVETIEERKPYPGLSSFTAADAEYFFGRELEVETVIKKLQQLHLMALIGPSGAGKTSFLRAGLIPALPTGWSQIFCVPGDSPVLNLGQMLVPELTGDTEAMQQMLRFDDLNVALSLLSRWRKKHADAVLVVDRFEELFTLNSAQVQSHFAELISRAPLEADIRVLLSMRDDFLMRCHDHPVLSPIFSELTPLGSLTGAALRRALVQPALRCNYRFEDETLVDEIIADIEKERGALPLMAFAASRLWEKRDCQSGTLTRQAYKEIGGVAGALAQHAESTMERIGNERQPIVREIFRNLITAQNTRAARDTEELLSVFPEKQIAEEVLRTLIDARLLTSFEAPQQEGEKPKRRVEIIHESLLSNWPRLVRWQTQDADSAQLRDQLRQAAQLWEQRNRSEDLLWTGTAFREFQLWRERYAGGLTTQEEAFGHAMVNRATRRRRQQRIGVIAIIVVLLSIVGIVTSFWRGEKSSRERALLEAQRAEASKLLALGRNEIEKDPSVALAHAVTSLEVADTPAARRFALEAHSKAPPVSIMPEMPIRPNFLEFSPDGSWLAVGGFGGVRLLRRDGKVSILEEGFAAVVRSREPQFTPSGDSVVWVSAHDPTLVRVWSVAEAKEIRQFKMEGKTLHMVKGGRLFLITDAVGLPIGEWQEAVIRSWNFNQKDPEILGRWKIHDVTDIDIDPAGRWIVYAKEKSVHLRPIENFSRAPDVLLGKHTSHVRFVTFHPNGKEVATADANGEIRIWSLASGTQIPTRTIAGIGPIWNMFFNHSGSILAVSYKDQPSPIYLWNLKGPKEMEPVRLRRNVQPYMPFVAFDPTDQLMVVAYSDSLAFWPLNRPLSMVLRGDGDMGAFLNGVNFTPDGNSLAAGFENGSIHLWPWPAGAVRLLWRPPRGQIRQLSIDPLGQLIGVGTTHSGSFLISLSDGKARQLPGSLAGHGSRDFTFSPDGKLAATGLSEIRIWDVQSDQMRVLEATKSRNGAIEFAPDGQLFYGDDQGNLRQWDLKRVTSRVVEGPPQKSMNLISIAFASRIPDLVACVWSSYPQVDMQQVESELKLLHLKDKTSREVVSHGNRVFTAKIDPSGKLLITGDMDGIVRVGPITGGEPHLLFGHDFVRALAVHPSGQWIASSELHQPIIRVHPMPTGKPFHTLPYRALLTQLRELTNIRIVADTDSATGYRTKIAPFPGWEKVPGW